MNAQPITRATLSNGMARYPATVNRNGQQLIATEFADWFANDAEAQSGFREIMESQGYTVIAVRVGELTVIEIA